MDLTQGDRVTHEMRNGKWGSPRTRYEAFGYARAVSFMKLDIRLDRGYVNQYKRYNKALLLACNWPTLG